MQNQVWREKSRHIFYFGVLNVYSVDNSFDKMNQKIFANLLIIIVFACMLTVVDFVYLD